MTTYSENERWYLALTTLWAERLRAEGGAGVERSPAPDIRFAEAVTGLLPGARVLDLACAWGRTTLELARRGYDVTGFDLSEDLLTIGRARAAAAGLAVPFIQGTVRLLPPGLGAFDAVMAFYDDTLLSFEDEAINLVALRAVARLLRPGGTLLFGTTDCPLTLPARHRREWQEASVHLIETIRFDLASLTGESVRAHRHPDGRTERYRRLRRHYTPAAASTLLARAGLHLRRAWNAYDTALPYGSRPEGLVLLATKGIGHRA